MDALYGIIKKERNEINGSISTELHRNIINTPVWLGASFHIFCKRYSVILKCDLQIVKEVASRSEDLSARLTCDIRGRSKMAVQYGRSSRSDGSLTGNLYVLQNSVGGP